MALLVLGALLGCVGGLGGYFFMPTKFVPGSHMRPTIATESSVAFNLLAVKVDRGDVVLFDSTAWGDQRQSVERVVAVGGDHISYTPGDRTLTLNGKPLDEPYVLNGDPVAGSPPFDVRVPRGRLFVLGDNRGNSADSRFRFEASESGTVPMADVNGTMVAEGDPLLVGLRSAALVGVAVLCAGALFGAVSLRLRRRAAATAVHPAYAGLMPPPGV
ncbi:signal peptidase I [Streptomyces xanthophaeus]|uniref:signal peptidase I n=1 Tax=Streptomyces xanthophaeus TaxID=67385 RepID=UPI002648F8BF|nr:signal peptidase I [Streptomyces xanthophaeus]WKD34395.1 signal peptidase I [Streptomyces xanthophaeus]